MIYNVISFLGLFFLVALGCFFSTNRKKVNWPLVGWGIGLQLIFALFIFRVPAGTKLFIWLNDLVVGIVDASSAGAQFLFGSLALPPGTKGSLGFFLAFQALPTIIFFSALLSVLYFVNLMPFCLSPI